MPLPRWWGRAMAPREENSQRNLLGLMFVIGPWIPPLYTGILMVLMVLSPILKQVGVGSEPAPSNEETEKNYKKQHFPRIFFKF